MRVVNSNHKSRRYSFPLPLKIRSDSPILITDGKVKLLHNGEIIIRSADTLSVEFEPRETEEDYESDIAVIVSPTMMRESSLPEGYIPLTTSRAKTTAYGRNKSVYEYYKRERDMSFIVLVRRNEKVTHINLGSLFDPEGIMSIALKEFSRSKPFYRSDLKTHRMPSGLRQGQRIKACLDVLVYEGFLEQREVTLGKKKVDRFVRTEKQLR